MHIERLTFILKELNKVPPPLYRSCTRSLPSGPVPSAQLITLDDISAVRCINSVHSFLEQMQPHYSSRTENRQICEAQARESDSFDEE